MKNTVTIGIPAYNESKNIKVLLSSLLSQKMSLYILDKIIISSDGSSDNTVQVVKSLCNPLIKIIDNKDRQGIARGLNQIIKLSSSDILVTLDADIFIKDLNFIDQLIKPIVENQADHTSSAINYLSGDGLVNHALQVGAQLKQILFDSLGDQNNIYHCFGLARAFSHRLYQDMSISNSIGNDMYTYLDCFSRGMKFIYTRQPVAWYKLPSNLKDHISQSKRFIASGREMSLLFGEELVSSKLAISPKSFVLAASKAIPIILSKPIQVSIYLIIQIYVRIVGRGEVRQAWTIAESSK